MERTEVSDRAAGSAVRTGKVQAIVILCLLVVLLVSASFVRNSRWRTETSLLHDIIDKSPDKPRAYFNLASLAESDRRYGDAIALLTRAIDLYGAGMTMPSAGSRDFYRNAYIWRGRLFAASGMFDRAVGDYSRALALDPSNARVFADRGIAFREMGTRGRAYDDESTAIRLDPSLAAAYYARGLILRDEGALDRALEDFNAVIALNPSDPGAYCERAGLLGSLGDRDRSIDDYTRALALDPQLVKAYLGRAARYRESGRMERARKDYRKACELGSAEGCAALGRGGGK